MQLTGLHHLTAITAHAPANLRFYTQVLGLRLVKLTVNFDDPGTYHFYFGDDEGSPGSILTFFPWPGASRGRVGVGQVSAVSFAVPAASLDWWVARLVEERVPAEEVGSRFGERVVRLGISLAGASKHAKVLRKAGLVTTSRHRNTALHTLTPLGFALLENRVAESAELCA